MRACGWSSRGACSGIRGRVVRARAPEPFDAALHTIHDLRWRSALLEVGEEHLEDVVELGAACGQAPHRCEAVDDAIHPRIDVLWWQRAGGVLVVVHARLVPRRDVWPIPVTCLAILALYSSVALQATGTRGRLRWQSSTP
jgi:hypothetical protein